MDRTDGGGDSVPEIEEPEEESTDEHLADLPDGAGCTDIWEYLSERRKDDD